MSTDQVPVSLPLVGGNKTGLEHPLGPLTAGEILQSSKIVKGLWPTEVTIQFKTVTLQEPEKAELVPFLNAEHSGSPLPKVDRKSFVVYYLKNTVSLDDLAFAPICLPEWQWVRIGANDPSAGQTTRSYHQPVYW